MAFMAWSQGSRQIHYCLNGHLAEPARLAAIPIAYYVKGCADVPLGHRLQPPRDLAWVFQRDLGRLCVHCPNHTPSGNCPSSVTWSGEACTQMCADRRASRVESMKPAYGAALSALGVPEVEVSGDAIRVSEALVAALGEDRGRWIL